MGTLRKLKRELLKSIEPSKEESLCKALKTIFHGFDEGMTEAEAFDILGWNYTSRTEMFGDYTEKEVAENITITDSNGYMPIIFNNTDIEIPPIKGNINIIEFIEADMQD